MKLHKICATSVLAIAAFSFITCAPITAARAEPAPELMLNSDGRSLVTKDNKPFFWLGDTAWNMFYKLNPVSAKQYFLDRKSKSYNVVLAIVLSGAPQQKNLLGETTLLTQDPKRPWSAKNPYDPTKPNEKYFANVDALVREANSLGFVVGLVPTWAVNVTGANAIFNETNARVYGEYLGKRYRSSQVVWILGGDQAATGYENVWRAMAEGLSAGDGGKGLKTYHPGIGSSSTWFENDKWLSFNSMQSGHSRTRHVGSEEFDMVAHDYALNPVKPVIDLESGYENIPNGLNQGRTDTTSVPSDQRLSDYDVRTKAYWSVFSGAFGYTYGAFGVVVFHVPGDSKRWGIDIEWQKALQFPGAGQMKYLRSLMSGTAMQGRVPAPELIASDPGQNYNRIMALRSQDSSHVLVYSTSGQPFKVNLSKLVGHKMINARWYNPRVGGYSPIVQITPPNGSFSALPVTEFVPPSRETSLRPGGIPAAAISPGHDWVLVLTAF